MEHLKELREAAAAAKKKAAIMDIDGGGSAKEPSALEVADIIEVEVHVPKIVLPKKRKVAETLALLEKEEGLEEEGEENVLNWRAKKSTS